MFDVQGIGHIALAVRDVERSASGYQEVLGLRPMREHGLPADRRPLIADLRAIGTS